MYPGVNLPGWLEWAYNSGYRDKRVIPRAHLRRTWGAKSRESAMLQKLA